MIGQGHYEKRGQGSLRARKEALNKIYNEEDKPIEKVIIKEVKEVKEIKVKEPSNTSKFEDIVQQQLDLIKKQNEQIEKLIHTISNGGVVSGGGVKEGVEDIEENRLDEPLFMDEFINSQGIEASGTPDVDKTIGESNEDKIKKLRELMKK